MLTDKQKQLIKDLDSVKKSAKTRPEYNAYQQMLTRIRRFGYDAVEDLLYLIEQLPEDELKKIFSDDRTIIELIKIIEMSIDAADWRTLESLKNLMKLDGKSLTDDYASEVVKEQKRKDILEAHVKNLMPHYLYSSEIRSFEELMAEYKGFSEISSKISKLESEIANCLRKTNPLSEFIKFKGLEEEFESYQSDYQSKLEKRKQHNFRTFVEYLRSPAGREEMKSRLKYTDEQMDDYIKTFTDILADTQPTDSH
jgi:hypothetical protein